MTGICITLRSKILFFDTLSVFDEKNERLFFQFLFKIFVYEGSKLNQIGLIKPTFVKTFFIF